MQLYNSMTRRKENFEPRQPGRVGMYACGITAYDLSHIGHARSAVVFDVLNRYLRYSGYDVTFVRNFTDVDDKIIARAHREGRTSTEIAETYIEAFHEDMDRLNVLRADIEPRATEYIDDMQRLIQDLIEGGMPTLFLRAMCTFVCVPSPATAGFPAGMWTTCVRGHGSP